MWIQPCACVPGCNLNIKDLRAQNKDKLQICPSMEKKILLKIYTFQFDSSYTSVRVLMLVLVLHILSKVISILVHIFFSSIKFVALFSNTFLPAYIL